MTIQRSPETGNLIAQCDQCLDVVDFEDDEDFDDVRDAIISDGWKTRREAGTWQNICPDCL